MLEVQGVCKSFDGRPILQDVSFKVQPGEIRVIVGLNGSGKTTLLKIIAGLLRPDRGKIWLGGQEVTHLPPEERRVGYVPQHPALFHHLTVEGNVFYGLKGKPSDSFIGKILDMLGLRDFLSRRPEELSGGYKSRVSLARALAPRPRCLLLDEPLSGFDLAIKGRLLPQFKRVLELLQVPVVFVTHDPWEAEELGHSFSVIVQGQVWEVPSAEAAFEILKESFCEEGAVVGI
ncbi:MAG TPA: ABC transporter ATP-binding protein [Moorella mulderi]|nr:ABC transporter ATP-binding protein [Moorella mulderi]